MSVSDDKYRENMKNAAEFLLKGGTLLSEPCEKCSGIQVKKNDEIKCIICGNTISLADNKTKEIKKIVEFDYRNKMVEKIGKRLLELITGIGSDKNLAEEEQRLRVIDTYIIILEKIKLFN
ncbi:MAG TPA: autoantigen p27 domain-containing protein [Nitrososphaeraceae archaeon]|nr:autoantigen p27 domain-containing protein [Nitrososphaeraceae archaeon]